MTHAKRPPLPPLQSWFYAAVMLTAIMLVLMLVLLLRLGTSEVPESDAFSRYNIERLNAMAGNASGHLVVLLGNSKLKYATSQRLQPDAATDVTHEQIPTSILRIVNNRAEFKDFSKIAKSVLDARPDLIVLQSALLVQERTIELDFRLLQEYVKWRLFAPESEFDPYETDQEALQVSTPCTGDFSATALEKRLRLQERHIDFGLDYESPLAAREFIERAQRMGIPVAVITLPNQPRLDTEFTAPDLDRLLTLAVTEQQVTLWRVPASIEIDDTDFCDFVHLNEVGRQKISAWLRAQVQAAIGR